MTTFYLVRHGKTAIIGNAIPGRMPGVHLDETGLAQAEKLASRLAGRGIAALYTSPLDRARETAEPVSRALGLPLSVREGLLEIDPGEWTGGRIAELDQQPLWRRYNWFRSGTRAPGGELMVEVQARMVTELEALRASHPEQAVAAFSHADTIKAAIMHYAGIPLDFHLRIEISPASISIITLTDHGPTILLVNGTDLN